MKNNEISIYFNNFSSQGILRINKDGTIFLLNKATFLSLKFLAKYGIENSAGINDTLDKVIYFLNSHGFPKIENSVIIKEFSSQIPLKRVQLEITKRCNLRCKHCYISEYKDVLESSTIYELIDEAASLGVMDFDLTGGEPLLYQNVEQIIEYILKYGMCTTIFTNAVVIPDNLKKILKKYQGVKFRVSLDGWNSESHDYIRGKGNFCRTLANIKELIGLKVPVEVNVILNSKNIIGVKKFRELSNELKIKFRYDRYLPFSRNDFLSVTDEEYIEALYNLPNFDSRARTIKENIVDDHKFYCGAGNSYVFVTASGEVGFCPTLSNTKFSGGNILSDSLAKIWNDSIFFNRIRKVRCRFYNECPVNFICQGGCRSRAEFFNGKITDPDIQECKLAYRISGIVPAALKGRL
ncbi:MAG TPA: radical SAM protein [Lactovum miscens]|uniref:radical SAM/SPASM domain-containing protein n=1 Tax=Lactovum miscens TaxID=190387 RepID=UPI002ED7F3E8